MGPLPSPPRARASASHLPPVRKIGSIDFRLNRRTVVDGYGAGPPEKAAGSYRGVLRRGGKRDFSPYLNRGLGESHSTQYASTREKFVDPVWLTPRLGKGYSKTHMDRTFRFFSVFFGYFLPRSFQLL